MDHKQVNQLNLIDRYLMGKLLEEESASFEEHFVDCPQCIARLQSTKCFLQDLRFVAAEQGAQIDARPSKSGPWQFLQMIFRKPLALVVGCVFIASSAGIIFAINHTRRLREEAYQAKSLSAEWERRFEAERQAASSEGAKHQQRELQLTEQLRALEAKLKDEQAQRAKISEEFSQSLRPESNLPLFVLTSQRGSETANSIALPRSAVMFAFSISLGDELHYERYRITIFDDRHRLIWKSEKSKPDRFNALTIGFRPSLFRPGEYSLILEGIKKEGSREEIGHYPFSIIRRGE